jgi:hypothetical protein
VAEEVAPGKAGRYASLFSGAFYAGTEGDCDYIAVKHGSKVVKTFRVRLGDVPLNREMRLAIDEAEW